MVSPTGDARLHRVIFAPLTSFSEFPPGTGLSAPETKRRKGPPKTTGASQRPTAKPRSPPIRGYLPVFRNSLQTPDCVVGPGDVPSPRIINDLACPTVLKGASTSKGQFPELSSRAPPRSPHWSTASAPGSPP